MNDSDTDGYWDGWIGVYGVERSENVVLYRENLDGGIEGDEVVPEQADIHTCSVTAPCATGVNVTGDATNEHSNVHLGELHWETDPAVSADNASAQTQLGVEVDFFEGADPKALGQLDAIEENYLLYGLDVDLIHDENLTIDDLRKECLVCDSDLPPISRDDANDIEDQYHDDTSKLYMFITTKGDDNYVVPSFKGIGGTTSSPGIPVVPGSSEFPGMHFGVLIFTEDYGGSNLELKYKKVIMHELGHILAVGVEDDNGVFEKGIKYEEVYSGDPADSTKEFILDTNNNEFTGWSIMRRGWDDDLINPPLQADYFVFSIEESSTIEFEDITTIEQ